MTARTVTLKVPRELYERLEALAEVQRTDVLELLRRLTEREADGETNIFESIIQRATDLGVNDLSEQHDHYAYGLEKQ